MLDMVQLKFYKSLLGLKPSTPNCMVYGELGCYPVSLSIKIRMVGYWLKLCSAEDNKISKRLYNLLYHFHETNVYDSEWLTHIRDIIQVIGLGHIWQSQGMHYNHGAIKEDVKYRLQCEFVQEWHGLVEDSGKCTLYKNIKTKFMLEPYLYRSPKSVWKYIVKVRCSNHKLAVEKGRYNRIERRLRHCEMCNMSALGDEYHAFLECNNPEIVHLRQRFIPVKL